MATLQHRPFELVEPVSAGDHSRGPDNAPVTVVEYGDFQCPNCKQAAPAVKLLLARFDGKVRFVWRHFPLEGPHPNALQAAEAAESAGAQQKFWETHDLLFDNQLHLEPDDLRDYAESLGLDMRRFDIEMQDHAHLAIVREHLGNGERSGVRSTPGFFINGKIQDVSFGLRSLFDATESALKKG